MDHLDKIRPIVSVICITYNQEKFIKKALDGFLMQKTTFPFEIIIHDDASTDKTIQILKKYKEENDATIRLELEKNNKFSKDDFSFLEAMFRMAKGKYIALCEGDDYWTDPTKLQKQVDFLEKNKEYSVCFHPVKVLFEDDKNLSYIFPDPQVKYKYNLKELLATNFIQTNSVMYRKQKYVDFTPDILPIDYYLHIYHAQFGKIGFINNVMAVYRKHSDGVWWGTDNDIINFWTKNWESQLKFYQKILDIFQDSDESIEIINKSIVNIFGKLFEVDKNNNDKRLLNEAIKKYPEFTATTIISTLSQLQEHKELCDDNEKQRLMGLLDKKDSELRAIKSSKFWKLRNEYSKMVGRKEIK